MNKTDKFDEMFDGMGGGAADAAASGSRDIETPVDGLTEERAGETSAQSGSDAPHESDARDEEASPPSEVVANESIPVHDGAIEAAKGNPSVAPGIRMSSDGMIEAGAREESMAWGRYTAVAEDRRSLAELAAAVISTRPEDLIDAKDIELPPDGKAVGPPAAAAVDAPPKSSARGPGDPWSPPEDRRSRAELSAAFMSSKPEERQQVAQVD